MILSKVKSFFTRKSQLLRPEYQYLLERPTQKEWVCLDFEMTGLNPKVDHILSVGAVRIIQNQQGILQIDSGQSLSLICRPPILPSADSIIIHGLRPIDVERGIDHEQLLRELLPFIANRPIVGFCVDLDMAFLNALVKPFLGINLPHQLIDVSALEQIKQQKKLGDVPAPRKHLNQLIDEYKIPRLTAHDALNDAMMTAMLFCHLYR